MRSQAIADEHMHVYAVPVAFLMARFDQASSSYIFLLDLYKKPAPCGSYRSCHAALAGKV
jgi:hypothetical protein